MNRSSTLQAWLFVEYGMLAAIGAACAAPVNVTEHHNHDTRDGLFIDPAFTQAAGTALRRDPAFDGAIQGNVYAQPLYIESGPGGKAMVIAVTESNNVYALDAADGSVIWQRSVGQPAPVKLTFPPCGNINPLGILGTPVVDLASRALFFDAMTAPDNGTTKRHLIYSLNVDTGTTNSGWPVDVDATVSYGATVFSSAVQNQRSALAILGGILYVPYGGNFGDCGSYHGWLVGVPLNNPGAVSAWATASLGGGAWAVGGVASDGINPFMATGNTVGGSVWTGGEAIIRFQPGPLFSNQTNDYWAPTNWPALDQTDSDLGGSGPLIVDVPGSNPPKLVIAMGKDGNVYGLNRTNLGGISQPLFTLPNPSVQLIQAAATYRTVQGTYVAFSTSRNQLSAFRIISPDARPPFSNYWTVSQNGLGSPFVTSTDGTNNVIVWGIGSEGDQRLHGFDGDTGATIFSGGGANELMAGTRRFNTGIAARGRIYIANDNKICAFTVPVPVIVLTNLSVATNGAFQFSFTNIPGMSFTVFGTTNAAAPLTNWTSFGVATEVSPGQFQFSDPQVASSMQRFYRVRTP